MNVVVVDKRGSALWIAAKNRGKFDSYLVLAALDYSQPRYLVKAILSQHPNLVVFAWRECLRDISNDYFSMKMLRNTRENFTIGVVIPDHIEDSKFNFQRKFHPLTFSDYFLVTSQILFEIYGNSQFFSKLAGILHDLPDYSYIEELNEKSRPIKSGGSIIWVGNSKWGKKQGYRDHKGLKEIMKPAFKLVQEKEPKYELIVIDSSIKRFENHSVLEMIQSADVLVQTSSTEGTGLPILEAMGLGTLVITTKVGVAPEILTGVLANQICERSPEAFAAKILSGIQIEKIPKRLLQETFRNFLQNCRIESIGPREVLATQGLWRSHQGHRLFAIRWLIRHFLALR